MTHYSIALVSDVPELTREALEPVAQALRIQVTNHFQSKWGIGATIEAHSEAGIPPGFWPIRILADIGDPSAAGFHTDQNNQPYAVIQYAPDWTITASHELLEMLFDPFGNALTPAVVNGKQVQVLQELCDPCEGFSYPINQMGTHVEVAVSDFLTPHYYQRPIFFSGEHYSFLNKLSGPMAVGVDGYLSYLDSGEWFQITNFGGQIQITDLGPNDKAKRGGMSLREWISQVSKIDKP